MQKNNYFFIRFILNSTNEVKNCVVCEEKPMNQIP